MSKLKKGIIFPFLLLGFIVQAQNRTIGGKILSSTNEPVSGTSVLVKGTNNGTTTNSEGSFSLSVPTGPVTLLISNVGFSQLNFQRLIGGSDHDRAQTIFNTFDNGFIINGASFSFGVGNVDATLIKTDIFGQIIWSYAYGTNVYDNSEFAIETSNRDILCVGRSNVQSGFPT